MDDVTEFLGRSSWGVILAVHERSSAELLSLVGVLIVIGCLVAAGVAAWRALWIASGCLLVVALVAGYLLL